MSSLNWTVGGSLVGSGLLLVLVCLPLLKDAIGPNHIYGVRLAKSFESRENWFKMNRYGARQLILGGLGMLALGIVALFLPLQTKPVLASALSIASLLFILGPVVQIFRYSKTI